MEFVCSTLRDRIDHLEARVLSAVSNPGIEEGNLRLRDPPVHMYAQGYYDSKL